MIAFEHVGKRYGGRFEALADVNFRVGRGEMLFLTGHSGAGKSSLLRLIMRLEKPSRGRVLVAGHDLDRLHLSQIPYYRRQIGVVFQDHQLLFDRSVFANVALPLDIQGVEPRESARRVRAALDKVGLLHREKALPIELSSGERQRVGIARAVVNKPSLLLADEPTGNLDPQLSTDIMRLFEDFNRIGTTVMVASHDLALIARLHHRVLRLRQGRLVGDEEAA
ncbi:MULTISPECIES: cell division ATP-binding protein FtsE [Chromohalobacter]|uniref:Cell division ATP-binding protein FtsE n=1 Tax=Chromohalobacter israelensis (strain ATCC BAA-138 / DSM 3043 / CIP 106854 / NCIMB 13768 / 1H11) TaxID=290398 RepID=Q1QT75_CHRI1|nr:MULTISPECIES: cell division ATP-binding protein FtsE [Chromohalobacter]ABE60333.1 cell division ATP-binding protein FtsE [Chromohalobacter salexigens DSM 3043]MBZ5876569.1 cell division ATP-binding protein FtsE [Chromohalobacter salexigens]MDO0946195.1 cell division ATP-binding protein FtsE [Chromohalobacter salexigens]NQY45298.1 cell division ATP-binding protein FtsE [Chromohalobacter sp.]NWO56520.1 cell division ATP-binding protein FtsE [Chromohalobacter salexigens]